MTETVEEAVPIPSAQQDLMARLGRPETVDALNRLLDRLDLIVFAADAADGLLRRGDELTDSVAGSLGELRHVSVPQDLERFGERLPQLARTGMQVADLAGNPAMERLLASGLIERLGDPSTIASLHSLLDHLDLVSFGVTAVDGFLRRGDDIIEAVADTVGDATRMESSLDLGRLKEMAAALPALADATLQVSRSGLLDHVKDLADTMNELHRAGTFGPKTMGVVGEMGAAAGTARQQKEYAADVPKGIFGLMGALRDPDVQRTLGFAIAFARNYGKKLKADPQ